MKDGRGKVLTVTPRGNGAEVCPFRGPWMAVVGPASFKCSHPWIVGVIAPLVEVRCSLWGNLGEPPWKIHTVYPGFPTSAWPGSLSLPFCLSSPVGSPPTTRPSFWSLEHTQHVPTQGLHPSGVPCPDSVPHVASP